MKRFNILFLILLLMPNAVFAKKLYGDVAGTTGNNTVFFVGGVAAAKIAKAANTANSGTSSDIPDTLVQRDSDGNFATNMITLDGTSVNLTDAATVQYVNDIAAAGLNPKTPAQAVAVANVLTTGTQTIDGVSLIANDRVLLTAQTNAIQNGLWLVQSGAWTRPTDFSSGSTAGLAYVLVEQGDAYAGSSWICNTPSAIIDTDDISFVLFSGANTSAQNVGTGTGDVFKDKTANTLNLRTLAAVAGAHLNIATSGDEINLSTDGTSANTPSTLVARNSSGNFNAGTITANLTGNVTGNVSGISDSAVLFTGGLDGDVSGSQFATQVDFVGIYSTAQVETAVAAVNSSTTTGAPSSLLALDGASNFAANMLTINGATTLPTDAASKSYVDSAVSGTVSGVYVLKSGDTMTGQLALPAGTTSAPALNFTGSTTTGITAATPNVLSLSTAGSERMRIGATGTVAIDAFTASGVVHNDGSGNLSSSLIVNSDITPGTITTSAISGSAGILGTQLATSAGILGTQIANATIAGTNIDTTTTITAASFVGELTGNASTATTAVDFSGNLFGDVSGIQTATEVVSVGGQTALSIAAGAILANDATSENIVDQLVARDSSGNFSTNMVAISGVTTYSYDVATKSYVDNAVSGSVSGVYVLKSGDTMSGSLVLPAGTTSAPSLNFTGSPTTGISAASNSLSLIANGTEVINIDNLGVITLPLLNTSYVVHTSGSGELSTGPVVTGDISDLAVTNDKLNNASHQSIANSVVLRDSNMSFSTRAITLDDGNINQPSLNFANSSNTGFSALAPDNLSFIVSGVEYMKIGSTGQISFDQFTTSGVIHNNSSGNLSSSLIVNSDVDPTAAIADTKLATISSAGKVSNSATTATSANNINTIVARDGSGNFSAATITASFAGTLTGGVIGDASLNVLKSGDTMSGSLVLPAGTTSAPSLNFTGSTTTGITAATPNVLSLSTAGSERMRIGATGTVAIDAFTTSGVVHNDGSGNLSSSLIVNSDITSGTITSGVISATAGIVGSQLANSTITTNQIADGTITGNDINTGTTITAASFVGPLTGNASTATTATSFSGSLVGDVTGTQGATVVSTVGGQLASNVAAGAVLANAATNLNTANAIVKRDGSGNFSTNMVAISGVTTNTYDVATKSYVDNAVSGIVTSGVYLPLAGGTLSGSLVLPAGSSGTPALNFTGSPTTGLSAGTTGQLSVSAGGVNVANMTTSAVTLSTKLITQGVFCDQAIQNFGFNTGDIVSANTTTSILFLYPNGGANSVTVNFPSSPTNGQMFTIALGDTTSVGYAITVSLQPSASIFGLITTFNPVGTSYINNITFRSVTYVYSTFANYNSWFRVSMG